MVDYWRLDFLQGDFTLVLPGDIPLTRHKRLRAYHQELKNALQGLNVWPLDSDLDLYPEFKLYYQKVMSLIIPDISCDELTSESRHRFLVCTEPFIHKDEPILGLSGLEQLMGFSFNAEITETSQAPTATTGDPALDIEVDVLLIFKKNALTLIATHSLEELAKMAHQANERMRPDSEGDDEQFSTPKPEKEDEAFAKNKPLILEQLSRLSVVPPAGF